MLAAYTAIDFGFNVSGLIGVGKWLPMITLVAFVVIMFWIVYDLKKDNYRLMNDRPTINVQPLLESDNYYLLVKNNGASANFEAQLKLKSNDRNVHTLSNLPFAKVIWDSVDNFQVSIPKGHSAKLKIASIKSEYPMMGRSLEIYFGHPNGRIDKVSQSQYFGAIQYNTETGISSPLEQPPSNEILITISSKPELREGVFQQRYKLDFTGLAELSELFTDGSHSNQS